MVNFYTLIENKLIINKMIKIYNTLTQKKDSIKDEFLTIYSCGITVYDYCHIGHARIFLVFDSFIRYLIFNNKRITFIRNVTDIDDKIIKKAVDAKISVKYVAKTFIHKMHADTRNLSLLEPSFEPRATNFLNNIISLISFLKKKKYAYCGINDDIYYNIIKNKNYGMLSRVILTNVKLGYKNFKVFNKHCDLDFTLWKTDGNFWYSPWGYGRPGWHSECAAMNLYYSKTHIDIHSGGKDLLFPHHENELAQMIPLKKFDFVKIWMHFGHVKIDNQKMSKSLNNYILIKDILKKTHEEYLRFFFLATHYRYDINYSLDEFNKVSKGLTKLYNVLLKLNTSVSCLDVFKSKFINVLNKDFNTPAALAILFDLFNKVREYQDASCLESQKIIFTIKYLGSMLGLFKCDPKKFLSIHSAKKKTILIRELLKRRAIARYKKNWAISDKIREQLRVLGIIVADKKIDLDVN